MRTEDAYTNLVLPGVVRQASLDTRDAAFVTELASGTIRRQGTYDAILGACIDRPLRKVEFAVLDLLRLGCHQLLSMRVPPHAAISSTVDLAHQKAGRGAAGFVNAVLRKVSRSDLEAVASPRSGPTRCQPGTATPDGWSTCWLLPCPTTSSKRCWQPTTSRPRSPWSRAPGERT